MHIPKFWAKGSYEGVACYRSSDRSVSDAKSIADDAARALFERIKHGLTDPNARGSYGYPNGPVREEVLKEVSRDRGELTAAITRNSYGCSVLNCADTLFVDIDFDQQPKSTGGGLFGRLFGKKDDAPPADPHADALKRVEEVVGRTGGSARVYATKAGLRVLFTHAEMNPKDQQVHQLFELLGADPLYVRLCKTQDSFRARLTPKPWRMSGIGHPPARWPYENEKAEQTFKIWLETYDRAAESYATCAHMKTFGGKTTRSIAEIVALHDQMTKSASGLPLA